MLFPKLFDIFLALSFVTLIYIVQRLYYALRVLNARVTILSTLVRNVSEQVKELGVEEEWLTSYERRDTKLQQEMRGDFAYSDYTQEELRTITAHSLVRPEALEKLATDTFPTVGSKKPKKEPKPSLMETASSATLPQPLPTL